MCHLQWLMTLRPLMTKVFESAVSLLSRREHGARELRHKLKQKGYGVNEVEEALAECQRLDLQNEARFVEAYSRTRIRQGYGPMKISQELSSKGVDKELIHSILQQEQANWVLYAVEAWQKKSKGQIELTLEEQKKQQRFLLYRGFDPHTISLVKKRFSKKNLT